METGDVGTGGRRPKKIRYPLNEAFQQAHSSVAVFEGKTVYLDDRIEVPANCHLHLRIESTHSEWPQGVWIGDMQIKKSAFRLTVNSETAPTMQFWAETAPPSWISKRTRPTVTYMYRFVGRWAGLGFGR